MVVKNLNLVPEPERVCPCGSWLAHWERYGRPSEAFRRRRSCAVATCDQPVEVGGHIQKEVLEGLGPYGMVGDASWYVLPLCATCNRQQGARLVVADDCGLAPTSPGETCGTDGEGASRPVNRTRANRA